MMIVTLISIGPLGTGSRSITQREDVVAYLQNKEGEVYLAQIEVYVLQLHL